MTKVGLVLPQLGEAVTPEVVRGFAERAEALGYSSLWVQEHLFWPLEPISGYAAVPGLPIPEPYRTTLAPLELLMAASAWTSRIRIGTSVLIAGYHRPVELAQRLATIDLLSGGRLSVGLAVGWSDDEHVLSDVDPRTRGRRCDDLVDAVVACWGEDPVSHEGPFFLVPPSIVRPKPVQQPRPPLLSGMWSTAGLARTVARFDGWNPAGIPVPQVQAIVADMDRRRAEVGKAPLTVHHRVFTVFPTSRPGRAHPGDEGVVAEVAAATAAGFDEVLVECNFEPDLTPESWLAVPDRLLPALEVAS